MRAARDSPAPPARGSKEVYEASSHPDPFQVLTAEHALLRLELSRAIDAATRAPEGIETRNAVLLLEAGFRLHQRREDLVMYPVCERLFGGRDGPASVLRGDHEAIRRAFDALDLDLEHVRPVSATVLQDLHRRLEDHFVKEERVLFPLMTAHLEGREAAELARRLRAPELA